MASAGFVALAMTLMFAGGLGCASLQGNYGPDAEYAALPAASPKAPLPDNGARAQAAAGMDTASGPDHGNGHGSKEPGLEAQPADGFIIAGYTTYFSPLKGHKERLEGVARDEAVFLTEQTQPDGLLSWRYFGSYGDFWVRRGHFVSDRAAVFLEAGAGYGSLRNRDRFFGIINTHVDAHRFEVYAGAGGYYYPLGVPEGIAEGQPIVSRASAAIRGARPFVSAASQLSLQDVHFDARITGPFGVTVWHHRERPRFTLLSIAPQAGLELPVGRNTSMLAAGGRLFTFKFPSFDRKHRKELDRYFLSVGIKRRF